MLMLNRYEETDDEAPAGEDEEDESEDGEPGDEDEVDEEEEGVYAAFYRGTALA